MRNLTVHNLQLLRRNLTRVPATFRPEAQRALELEGVLVQRLRAVYETRLNAQRIRCHGDFHLGQVLYTGKDFILIDFEGERSVRSGERRIKRSPLRDVAGMIRSFDYVTYAALFRQLELGTLQEGAMAATGTLDQLLVSLGERHVPQSLPPSPLAPPTSCPAPDPS